MTSSKGDSSEGPPITFRYVGIPHEPSELAGIGLWYRSDAEAQSDFAYFHDYLTSIGSRRLTVSFEADSTTTHKLTIDIQYPAAHYVISVSGIRSDYVKQLCESLKVWPYYFIVAGYLDDGGEPVLLPPDQYTIFASTVLVEGEQITGNRQRAWPSDVFQPGPVTVIEDKAPDSESIN